MSIGIFYGSNGGATKDVANEIKKELNLDADVIDIADATKKIFNQYDKFILGTSTWGEGDLQDDWEDNLDMFKELNFSGKTVALFGVGDQVSYEDTFVDGMNILYEIVKKNGASIVGDKWPAESYDFSESLSLKDGIFIGLVIDDDNQDEQTSTRIKEWTNKIKKNYQ